MIQPFQITIMEVELFSWKTTSNKDHIEVCLPNGRLLSGPIGMWSSMKITLINYILLLILTLSLLGHKWKNAFMNLIECFSEKL